MPTALVAGSAGFIGSFVCERLLEDGWRVIGLDCLSDEYDVSLKTRREDALRVYDTYRRVHAKVEPPGLLMDAVPVRPAYRAAFIKKSISHHAIGCRA